MFCQTSIIVAVEAVWMNEEHYGLDLMFLLLWQPTNSVDCYVCICTFSQHLHIVTIRFTYTYAVD